MTEKNNSSTFRLLKSRRFLPLFITQFLGAFNDNLYKLAMLALIVYVLATGSSSEAALLSNIAAGLFMLPFFLASALAGQLSDKYEKSTLIKFIKLWEIGLMIIGAYGFYTGNIVLMMIILFGMGLQSTFFGPIKYAILPQHLEKDELLPANSLMEAGVFLAILLGTLFGAPLILAENGIVLAAMGTISIAVLGFITALFIPKTARAAPDIRIRKNIFAETRTQFREAKSNPIIFLSIIGTSWFWMFGSVFLAQITPMARSLLYLDEYGMTAILALFTVGIGIGSILCNRILKGQISGIYQRKSLVIILLCGIFLYGTLVWYSTAVEQPVDGTLISVWAFIQNPITWVMGLAILGMSAAGGMFIVPLYARLQHQSDPDKCSRTIASNNVMNSVFMVLGAVAALLILKLGSVLDLPLDVAEILLIVSLLNYPMIKILKPLEQDVPQSTSH
ncbi:MFS transporter [Temperatibacter marinus]|uniref:MFS transporter n=1 Tax=Temperatibacter marinus TaxID=1456591 RepID=A0AA52EIH2_9PROT|nr:MFS transporter [Temperatibacter marinus]WND03415.1 MFS transporter [Temperatibacter marinus]